MTKTQYLLIARLQRSPKGWAPYSGPYETRAAAQLAQAGLVEDKRNPGLILKAIDNHLVREPNPVTGRIHRVARDA